MQDAMQALIDAKLVTVRRENMWLEIEINTDILFPSGSGAFSPAAEPVLDKLAEVLKPFPNPIRVEGHTDDRPIHTAAFPSNWELSAARAASVVHQFTKQGIDPLRLEIVGFGEFHPRQANDTSEGRNANRRVAVLVLEAVAPGNAVTAKDARQIHRRPIAPRTSNCRCRQRHRSAAVPRGAHRAGEHRSGQTTQAREPGCAMSEVDRLSNSGLYPALPIADRRSSKDEGQRGAPSDRRPPTPAPKTAENPDAAAAPRPPTSRIDDYA